MHLMQCQGAEKWAKSIGFSPHYYSAWKQWRGVICWHFQPQQMEFPVPKNCWQDAHLVLSACHYRHYHLHLLSSLASDLFLLLYFILYFLCFLTSWFNFSKFFVIAVWTVFPLLRIHSPSHSFSVVQNIWIPSKRTRLSHDVKTARSTPWITQATTAHPTVSPKERTSTSMSPSTSTPSIPPLSWAWKPWGEMVCPYPLSLLLLSQPQPQAPIFRLPSRLACPTTLSPQPNHLHLAFLATMVHRLTSSMPTTPSNLQGNLAIQVAALLLRAK